MDSRFTPTERAVLTNLIIGRQVDFGLPWRRLQLALAELEVHGLIASGERGWTITEAGILAIRQEMIL